MRHSPTFRFHRRPSASSATAPSKTPCCSRLRYAAMAGAIAWLAVGASAGPAPYGLWEFNNNLNRSGGTGGSMASGGTISYVAGVGGAYDTTAVQVGAGKNNRLACTHAMPANGGGSYVNEYTLMYDVKYPTSGTWKCLLQTNPSNSNDGDFFINTSNKIGSSAQMGGYSSSSLAPNTWYRVVLVVDSSSGVGGNDVIVFVNGSQWLTKYDISVDSTLTLDPSFFLSEDNDGEDDALIIGTFATWNVPLSATDVAALGAVGSSIVHPVIAQGDTLAQTMAEDATWSFTLNASDPNGDSVTWSVTTPPASGTLDGATGTGYTRACTYTPFANFNGTDSFRVRVTDATGLTDEILVTATVTPANDMPRFTKGANQSVSSGSGPRTVAGWATAIDDGDPERSQSLTFAVAVDLPGLFLAAPAIAANGTLTFTPSASAYGTATVTVTLTDDATAGGPALTTEGQTFTIAVVNTLPTIIAPANTSIPQDGTTGPLAFTVGDAETTVASLVVTATSDNPVLVPPASVQFGGAGPNRTVSVTPVAGRSGAATLTLTVSDGVLTATDSFTLTVVGEAADHLLIVFSEHGGADPAVGTNTVAHGVPLLCQVTNSPIATAGTQWECTGWTLVGGEPSSGLGTSLSAIPTNDLQLAWNWTTNHWLELGVSGGGTLTAPADWYAAGSDVTVDALGNDAWRFAGWLGDTAGCAILGNRITVPMSGPRGPITALFAHSETTLTVLPVPGTCVPEPGAHSFAHGAEVACSATDRTDGLTQYACIGWRLDGGTPRVGTGRSFTTTLVREAELAWLWQTNHWLDTAVAGSGTVSEPDGWRPAGQLVELVATPAAGQRFVEWTGDTAGATVGGPRLVLPMDRPRGPITATFAADSTFEVIALPDTQNYSTSYPNTYNGQCQWIVNNKTSRNIQFVTHLGDIVNTASSASEWSNAATAMNILNGQIPYGVCRGNHDMGSRYTDNFGPNAARWKTGGAYYNWYGGASPSGNSSYQMIAYGGRTFLFLHLDVDGPGALTDPATDLGWAQSVINSHRGVLTILSTHDYLAEVGSNSNTGSGTGSRGPCCQAYVGGGHSGLWLRENFVLPNNEIFMVICGHNFAQYNLAPNNHAGKPVHEVMVDYQTLPNGGNGFLRIMSFRPSTRQIVSTTWSTSLNRFMTRPANATDSQGMLELTDSYGSEFTINFDFDTRFDGTLTIASAQGPVVPSVGSHSFASGAPVLCQAPDSISGQTRRRATGWTLAGSQSDSGSGNAKAIVMNGNATLTWTWAADHWLETADIGDGQVSLASGWQPAGSLVTLEALPDPGATFVGWSGDTDGCTVQGATLFIPVDRPRGPVTAQFSAVQADEVHTLQIVSDEPVTSPPVGSYLYVADSVVTCAAPATVTLGGTQSVCVGWTLAGVGSGSGTSVDVVLDANRTLTWNWAYRYALAVSSEGPGSVAPASSWVDADASVLLTAMPADGATFAGWEGDLDGATPNGATLAFTHHRARGPIVARFVSDLRSYDVRSAHGTPTPTGTVQVAHGSVVTNWVADEVRGGFRYACAGWTLEGLEPATGTSNRVVFACTNNAVLTWQWETQALVRVTSEGRGVVAPLDAAGWHRLGTILPLVATPTPLFRFGEWSGDASGGEPALDVAVDAPRTLHARFVPATAVGGTPHWWLDTHGLLAGGATSDEAEAGDADRDGFTAAQEQLADTDPNDSASALRLAEVLPGPPDVLAWRSSANRCYDILCATNRPTGFFPLLEDVAGSEGTMSVDLPAPGGSVSRFYRVRVRPPAPANEPPPRTNALLRAMDLVPAGAFTMGDDASALAVEKPAHPVELSAFRMDRYEVSRDEWRTVTTWAAAHGYDLPLEPQIEDEPRPGTHAVTPVSWYEAVKWCNARSELEGRTPAYYTDAAGLAVYRQGDVDLVAANVNWSGDGYRLPTEAEWEYAARGGLVGQDYPWGNEAPGPRGNYWQYWTHELEVYPGPYPWTTPPGYFDGTQPAKTPPAPDTANGYGLYDMAGNLMEWCWDRRAPYTGTPDVDPRGPDGGDERALRGGSWWNEDVNMRCAFRYFYLPVGDPVYGSIGFRCVRRP